MNSNIPRLDIFVHPSISGKTRKRLWYTLKTLLKGAGFAWNARCSLTDCDILVSPEPFSQHSSARVRILFSDRILSQPFSFNPCSIKRAEDCVVFHNESNKNIPLVKNHDHKRLILFDIIGQTFWLLIGGHEQTGKDAQTIPVESRNILVENNLLAEPLIEKFARLIFQPFENIRPGGRWSSGRRFAVALSHDVDYPFFLRWPAIGKAFLGEKNISGAVRLLFQERPDFWIFDKIMQEESHRKLRSAFYFSSRKGKAVNFLYGRYDTTYDIREARFRELFSQMTDHGFEIGLHASLMAHKKADLFREEVDWLRECSGIKDVGNRHHCWQLNPEAPNETLAMHAEVGLFYDSSLMFHYYNGLRRGTCLPFHPYDLDKEKAIITLQLCPVLMDDYMFAYRRLNKIDNPRDYIDQWLATMEKYGGLFVADYHQHLLHEELHPAERQSYLYLLDEISSRDYILADTPLNIARLWLSREWKLEKESINED